jgi:hypothetical protein
MSQPAREYIVKIIELSLWSSDLLLGHLLLFMLTPPILVPYFDRLHATLLCESRSFFDTTSHSNMCCSLAAAIEADPCSTFLHQAETATALDCTLFRPYLSF